VLGLSDYYLFECFLFSLGESEPSAVTPKHCQGAKLEQFGSGKNQLKRDTYRILWPNARENMFLFVFCGPLRGRHPECLE